MLLDDCLTKSPDLHATNNAVTQDPIPHKGVGVFLFQPTKALHGQKIMGRQGAGKAFMHGVPAGPIALLDILYRHRPAMAQGNLYIAHRYDFTQKVLSGTL